MIVATTRMKAQQSQTADLDAYLDVVRDYYRTKNNRKITGRIKTLDGHLEAITLMTPAQRRGFGIFVNQRIAELNAQESRRSL